MPVKYGKFELPAHIKIDDSAGKSDTFARFIAEPFERGYGHTIGNALRRIMLTSMEAPSIVSAHFEGIPHEYMAVDGVIEDMTHIVLNLKGALLRLIPLEEEKASREPQLLSKLVEYSQADLDKAGGQITVTLADLVEKGKFDLVNPDHAILNITKPFSHRVNLKVAIGRGYVPSERQELRDKVVDEIVIDSSFSPVRLVNYYVENTRVGQDTDYDKLILDVTTDGRITPEEALSYATQIGILHFQIFEELKLHSLTYDEGFEECDDDRDAILAKLALKINEIELSVRSTNCLEGAEIGTIAELVIMPESDMLKFRNFGKKSLNEIKDKLTEMGLHLGMDLSRYGITRDNVKEIVDQYQQEKAGAEA